MMRNYLAILALVFVLLPRISYAQSFLNDQRYRGWFWFENKPVTKDNLAEKPPLNQTEQSTDIAPEEARVDIEQFAKELEALKFMMLARPTLKNVKAYRDKEKAMWTHAETLHDAWDMANLLYPGQRDLINNPVNVHGIKAKREIAAQEDGVKIRNLAKQFDLVLFFDSSCRYCQLLSPVLKSFGEKYGFNIDAISRDGTKHEYFKTANVPELIEKLGITGFPTVIAISHDSKTAFELIRGYVSISELEEYSLLAIKYLQNQEIWQEK